MNRKFYKLIFLSILSIFSLQAMEQQRPIQTEKPAESAQQIAAGLKEIFGNINPSLRFRAAYTLARTKTTEEIKSAPLPEELKRDTVLIQNVLALKNTGEPKYYELAQHILLNLIDNPNYKADPKALTDSFFRSTTLGDKEIVEFLIRKGVNVDAKYNYGRTALIIASKNGYTQIAELLINNGANIDETSDDENTALMIASGNGHEDIVKLLIDKGANVNSKDNQETTALMFALAGGHNEIAKLLISKGADVNARNIHGRPVLNYARDSAIIKLLKEHGAE